MQKYMRVCPLCAKENNKIGKNDVAGWIDWFKSEEILDGTEQCHKHKILLEKKLMTCEEFNILNKISIEPSFIQAMEELKEKDIIEFNLKMSQFKSQLEHQESVKQEIDNKIYCPKCKSTSITTGARGVNFTWGLFGASKTVNRCANCGHTWKP